MNQDGHRSADLVKTTDTVFTVIEALYESQGASLTQLTEELDISKSTVYKHLETLKNRGYVIHEAGRYDIGLRFLDLGAYAREQREVTEAAHSELQWLVGETKEIAWLMVEENGWGVCLCKERGDRAAQLNFRVGERTHLHVTSTGKAILANLPQERIDEIVQYLGLPKIAPRTVTDLDELEAELAEIREEGVAFAEDTRLSKVRTVASPILTEDDVHGAIGVAGPRERLTGDFYNEEIPELLRGAANAVELSLDGN